MTRLIKKLHKEWMFHLGDVDGAEKADFDDIMWRELNLPHDWSIEGRFLQFRDEYFGLMQNLDHRVGYLPQGIGWYRKEFHVPQEWEGKKVTIQFDGVYRESKVWINGKLLGFRPYGYASFWYDLTPHLLPGKHNVIAVRVDNTGIASRWYAGSGIYRKVTLTITDQVHVAQWGTYVTTPEVSKEKASVLMKTTIDNDTGKSPVNVELLTEIMDGDSVVAKDKIAATIDDNSKEISQELNVDDPSLWSPENPHLYKIKSTVLVDGIIVDEYYTSLGIRWFIFNSNEGFFLNDVNMKFKGVCLHHDNGPLGAKVYDRSIERKLEILRGMGCNAIRTSHNPPSQEMLEACDRMGFLVMDEVFDEWTEKNPKTPMGYTRWFNKPVKEGEPMCWYERDVIDFVHRDRNHPCVILWSCGNEVGEQNKRNGTYGVEVLQKLLDVFHREDPTRPVTQGCNQMADANETGFSQKLDVVGYNYYGDRVLGPNDKYPFKCMYDVEHEKYPDRIMIGSENCSAFNTRGVFEYPVAMVGHRHGKMRPNFQMTSYDVTSEWPLMILMSRPYVCGYFSWEGFDYIGEPSPYPWPARSSYFGIVDLCGFLKDTYYLHKSMWVDEPMVHIVPSMWNFHDGQMIEVWAYTNCESVELFLNGKSLGEMSKEENDDIAHVFWDVKYEPGELKAIAKTGGKEMAVDIVTTTRTPHHLEISADRTEIQADGEDIAYLTVNACDIDGKIVPTAENLVTFTVEGPGKVIGVGNGNPISHEPFCDQQRHLFMGYALGVLQSDESSGEITVTINAPMLKPSSVIIVSKK